MPGEGGDTPWQVFFPLLTPQNCQPYFHSQFHFPTRGLLLIGSLIMIVGWGDDRFLFLFGTFLASPYPSHLGGQSVCVRSIESRSRNLPLSFSGDIPRGCFSLRRFSAVRCEYHRWPVSTPDPPPPEPFFSFDSSFPPPSFQINSPLAPRHNPADSSTFAPALPSFVSTRTSEICYLKTPRFTLFVPCEPLLFPPCTFPPSLSGLKVKV